MTSDGTIEPEKLLDQELDVLELVGERVRFVRKRYKLTAKELSRTSGLPMSHISAIERGKANPTVQTLDKIARGIGCSLRDLMPQR